MSTYQTTLKDNSGNELLPKTVLKAIADDNGYYLDSSLSAADINVLKNGMLNNTVRHSNETPGTPPPIDADQLNGHPDTYFGTASDVAANASAISSLMKSTYPSINVHTENFTVNYVNFCKRGGWVICAFSAQALTTGGYIVAIDGLPRSATSHYGFGTNNELYVIDNNGANNSCRIRINRSGTINNLYVITYPMLTDEV